MEDDLIKGLWKVSHIDLMNSRGDDALYIKLQDAIQLKLVEINEIIKQSLAENLRMKQWRDEFELWLELIKRQHTLWKAGRVDKDIQKKTIEWISRFGTHEYMGHSDVKIENPDPKIHYNADGSIKI